MQNKIANKVSVSISVCADIEVTEKLKQRIKEKYPYVNCFSDEDYAIVALFAASDNCLPKLISWEGQEIPIKY